MMRKMRLSRGLFRGSSSKGEKAAGENARMLPKTTGEERSKQEPKKKGKLKNMAGKLLRTIAGGKEAAEKMLENENLAGNLMETAISKKEVEKRSAGRVVTGPVPPSEATRSFLQKWEEVLVHTAAVVWIAPLRMKRQAWAALKEKRWRMEMESNLPGLTFSCFLCHKISTPILFFWTNEETIRGFIKQGKLLEACKRIYNLECSGSDGVGKCEKLYALLAEQMWSIVEKAFSGCDSMFLEPLQSVSELLRWEKEKKKELFGRSQEMEPISTWSPGFCKKDLEEKLIQYMTAQIPPFNSTSNTDETALKQHLRQLEMTFLPNLEHKSGFFKEAGLLPIYTHCSHACLSSHLSTLTDMNHASFSQCLLVYEWCLKMCQSGNCSQILHAQHLLWIIFKTEEKLLAVTQKEVEAALKAAFGMEGSPGASTAVIQAIAEKTEAAQRVGESLQERVGAVCLQESLSFLQSYENEVRRFLQPNDQLISSSLRVLENCCILRVVWHKIICICSVSSDQDVKVKGFLEHLERKIVDQLLQKITSEVTRALKDYFKKCDSSLGDILESLKKNFVAFKWKNAAIYEVLVKNVHDVIIKEYTQALLTISRKPLCGQRRRIVSRIEEDHRMLQTIVTECLGPKADSFKDPIKAVLELIQNTDSEGMKIALVPILRDFPNLRKEHLSIILYLKDSLSRGDRTALLKTFNDNYEETRTNLLFEDIEVKPGRFNLCCCFSS